MVRRAACLPVCAHCMAVVGVRVVVCCGVFGLRGCAVCGTVDGWLRTNAAAARVLGGNEAYAAATDANTQQRTTTLLSSITHTHAGTERGFDARAPARLQPPVARGVLARLPPRLLHRALAGAVCRALGERRETGRGGRKEGGRAVFEAERAGSASARGRARARQTDGSAEAQRVRERARRRGAGLCAQGEEGRVGRRCRLLVFSTGRSPALFAELWVSR